MHFQFPLHVHSQHSFFPVKSWKYMYSYSLLRMTWEGKSWKCPYLQNKEKLRMTWEGNGGIMVLRLRMTWQGKKLRMPFYGSYNSEFERLRMTWGGQHKLTMPWGGKSKIENDLMGVENALGAEFVKMHSPRIQRTKCVSSQAKRLRKRNRRRRSIIRKWIPPRAPF